MAWTRLDHYPLVALAAISETQLYRGYETEKQELTEIVSAATLFIIAFTLTATYLAIHLRQKRRREQEVKSIFRLAVNGGRDGFCMIRPIHDEQENIVDFSVEDCNEQDAALAGYQRKNLLGAKFSDLYRGDYRDEMMEFFKLAMEKGFLEDEIAVSP